MSKPRILVASDTRLPSGLEWMHGLGKSACEIAAGLKNRGYPVTLYGHPESEPPPGIELLPGDPHDEVASLVLALRRRGSDWDVLFDTGHDHLFSRCHREVWGGAVINRICDREIAEIPLEERGALENKVVNSEFMRKDFPRSELILTGPMRQAELVSIAASRQHDADLGGYILFMGEWHPHKRCELALRAAKQTGIPIAFACGKSGQELMQIMARASLLFHRSSIDAAPRSVVECAMAGVPSIVSPVDGAAMYVVEGETGFIVPEDQDAQTEVLKLHGGALEPWGISLAAQSRFDYEVMISQYAALVDRAARGERW